RWSTDRFSCSALTRTERQAQLCGEYDRPRSQLAVEVCLCPKRHLFCVKLSVVSKYPDAIRSAYSFRPRAVREDYLRLVEGREKMQSGFSLPIRKRLWSEWGSSREELYRNEWHRLLYEKP